jgi:hypothetical protein
MSRSLESGPVISGNHVRLAPHPIVVAENHADGTPIVTLRREGDLIKEIQIRCACGELIVLDCEYSQPGIPISSKAPAARPVSVL